MKKSSQYVFIGCGSCLALVVLAIAALVIGGARLTQNTMSGFEEAIEARQEMEGRFGDTRDFVPWPQGAIPPARMESFLGAREAMAPVREKLASALNVLPATSEQVADLESKPFLEKMEAVFDITTSGIGLGAEMGEFFAARNRSLLEAEMGLGEYTYLYVLGYYVFLDRSVDDSGGGIPMPNMARDRIFKDLRGMVRRQLAALPESEGATPWRGRLEEELAALEADPERFPWQDGLPEGIASSLEPYRERLGASYSAASNAFELARNVRRGRLSITAE